MDVRGLAGRKLKISATTSQKVMENRLLFPLFCHKRKNNTGNDDWNQSAPHGAGRLLSRSDTKELIGMEEY